MSTGPVANVKAGIERFFPERQFYHRSLGEVRFISLSARNQLGLVSVLVIFLIWVAYASVNVVFKQQIISAKERKLTMMRQNYEVQLSDWQSSYDELNAVLSMTQDRFEETTKEFTLRHDQLSSFKSRHAAISTNYEDLQARLSKRAETGKSSTKAASSILMQAIDLEPTERVSRVVVDRKQANLRDVSTIIRSVVGGREASFHRDTAHMSDRVELVSVELDDLEMARAGELNKLEEQATLSIEEYEAYLRATGLDLERIAARFQSALPSPGGSALGIGGPLEALEDGTEFASEDLTYYDRQLLRIDGKLRRLSSLETALSSIPIAMPVSNKLRKSSRFGPRRDPFTKRGARHSGLDFAGPYKSSIYATAAGKVIHAGRRGPYGNMVEIDHGHRFRTRYGHMYRVKVKRGQQVEFGQIVGLLGSSGRSTGPHLHYEVWFEGIVRDPDKFVKVGRHVLKS
jgi:murein DD-endopeptidase MepM/ murein hydrolase activator NlpD